MQSSPQNLRGQQIPMEVGPGSFLTRWRKTVIGAVNSFLRLRILIKTADGKFFDADIKQTPLGTIATLDLATALSGSGSASIQQFKIVSDGGDYWNCNTWDGTTLGSTTVKVAKPYKLRCGTGAITSETIRSVTYTYTYNAVTSGGVTIYYTRGVTGSDGSAETNYMIPDALTNNIIYGISFSTTTPSSLSDCVWLDINADARAWAA